MLIYDSPEQHLTVGSTALRVAAESLKTSPSIEEADRRACIRVLLEAGGGASIDPDLRANEHVKVKESWGAGFGFVFVIDRQGQAS